MSVGPAARTAVLGAAAYQLVSGAWLWLGRDGLSQLSVLGVHVLSGLVLLAALGPYLIWHVRRVRGVQRTAVRALGVAAATTVGLAAVSGLWIGGRAALGWWTGDDVREYHRWVSLVSSGVLVLHLASVTRTAAARAALRRGAGAAFGALVVSAGSYAWSRFDARHDGAVELPVASPPPPPATVAAGPRGPIPPLGTGGRMPRRSIFAYLKAAWARPPESASCGASGCHGDIVREWRESAHGWADRDPYYLALERRLAAVRDHERLRYCNECHDPVMLLNGAYAGWVAAGADGAVPHTGEAVACVVCHAMSAVHGTRPRGNYEVAPQPRALWPDDAAGRTWTRAGPEAHRRANPRTLYERSRMCAGCHRADVVEEVPGFGLLRIENPVGRWELARVKPLCQDCHMPAVADSAGAATLSGEHMSHRFAGSSAHLSTDPEHLAAVQDVLAGRAGMPDVTGSVKSGALFTLSSGAVVTTTSGAAISLELRDNGRIGHQFPAGAQDLMMVWLEAEITAADGAVLARFGEREPGGSLWPGTPVFRRGGLYRPRRGPAVAVTHAFDLPGEPFPVLRPGETRTLKLAVGRPRTELSGATLTARLCYRKLSATAAAALGLTEDRRPLPLPPRSVLAELRSQL